MEEALTVLDRAAVEAWGRVRTGGAEADVHGNRGAGTWWDDLLNGSGEWIVSLVRSGTVNM